jgi:hypothetical protein
LPAKIRPAEMRFGEMVELIRREKDAREHAHAGIGSSHQAGVSDIDAYN